MQDPAFSPIRRVQSGRRIRQIRRVVTERHARRRLWLESLENRLVLSTVPLGSGDLLPANEPGTGSIGGHVYLDRNGNGQLNSGEAGVPGSLLTLTGVTTQGSVSITRTALTADDGSYYFANVAPGTYAVTQTQPKALIDGAESTNDSGVVVANDQFRNIVVTSGSSLNGFNFAEHGPLTSYVNVTWFFASGGTDASRMREVMARAEAANGNQALAAAIRRGDSTLDPNANVAPTAINDAYSLVANSVLTVAAANGVLANDVDPNGDALTATLVSGPTSGTLALNPNGSFTYTPTTGFTGTATFTYRASDGQALSNIATVTITVTAVNNPPVAVADSYRVAVNQTLTVSTAQGVLANDTDADGNTLTAQLVDNVAHGTLNLNANGSFTYTPTSGFQGVDTFTYRAFDGQAQSNVATVTITVNTAPVAVNDSYTVAEDQVLTVTTAQGVLANDTDVDGDTLTAAVVTGPQHGALTLNSDGSFTYTPQANFHGTDTFTYRANDGLANSEPATVTITITPTNDAPVATDDAYSVARNSTLIVGAAQGVLANDSDPDGDTITAQLVDDVAHGTLVLNADGSFTYTPVTDYQGLDTFTYRASDGQAVSNVATVTITVNSAPVATNDSYSVDEDQVLTVTAPQGVLANDTDAEGDALTAELVASTQHGTLTLNADGSFTYTPDADFHGTDTFTYRARDSFSSSNIATVTITVNPINDAPVAANDAYTVAIDGILNVDAVNGVLANDVDVDGDTLVAILVAGPAHGTLELNQDGSFSYTPNLGFQGIDTFTYQASDGEDLSNVATVTITVNSAPVAQDDSYDVDEDNVLTVDAANGVLVNDSDPDGDTLVAELVAAPQHGTLTLNADGSFVYTPDQDFFGTDTFTYRAQDGLSVSNVATVTITINPVNDPPVAVADTYSVPVNGTLTVDADAGVLANDTDVDGDELSAVLVDAPQHGTLELNADGSFTYTPDEDFRGTDTFTYQASDGQLLSSITAVTIIVNTSPVAEDDGFEVDEDNVLTVDAASGVLANDSDADGDALIAELVTPPQHGTLTLNADGSFVYTPDQDFFGTDTFTYRAQDGLSDSNVATVTITINPVNDPPVAVADAYSVPVNGTLTVNAEAGVLANDTDIEGDELSAVLVAAPQHGTLDFNADGSFTYTPDADFRGIDTFTYQASDGQDLSSVATVTIVVNTPPVAQDDAYTVDENGVLTVPSSNGVLANDTDADGDSLTVTLVDPPQHGDLTLNADGSFVYTPNTDFLGTDTFTYRAHDGLTESNIATVTITVTSTNTAPVAASDEYQVAVGQTLIVDSHSGLLANDSDADGDELEVVLVADVSHGTLELNTDGSFTYIPDPGFRGIDTFTYQATDGIELSNIATVTIIVNTVPDAQDDVYDVDEDGVLTVDAPNGVLANDSDVDGDTLTAILVTPPQHGTLTLNADGSFEYTPDADFFGTDTFTYRVGDGLSLSDIATVTITVNPINDAPVGNDDSYAVAVNATLSVDAESGVLANDTDVENDPLTAVLVDGPTHGVLEFNADGSFTYTPDTDFRGIDTFTYRATDGDELSNLVTVTITVNTLPVAQDDVYDVDEDGVLTVDAANGVLANDSDADGDTLTAVLVAPPQHGTLTFNPDGSFEYTPDADFFGTDTFSYRVDDGLSLSDIATVTITVNPINDAPVGNDDSYAVAVNATLSVDAESGVLANDTDVENDPLTAVLVDGPTHGVLEFNADGSFTYTPDTDFRGIDTFTYRATDGDELSNLVTVTITVNTLPVAQDDVYDVDEDGVLTVDAANGVLANDSDADGDTLTAVLVAPPQHGTLTLNPDGSFEYTPDADFFGTDTFAYRADDGLSVSEIATVTITVNPVNDPPVALDDAYEVDEDGVLTVDAAAGVLANDTDADGDSLTAVLVTPPNHGTLTLNPDGSFEYTPAADFHGTDTFTYVANDGLADSNVVTVTITVNPVNDAPIAQDDSYQVDVDGTLVVDAGQGVLANDSDVDGDSLTAVLVDAPAHGTLTLNADGSFTYTPEPGFRGVDAFTYQASDGELTSQLAVVTITVNTAPVGQDDAYDVDEDGVLTVDAATGVLANDSDADGDPLAALLVATPSHGTLTLNADGSFEYTPAADFHGTDAFTYVATDGLADSNVVTVTITVNPINDAPVAQDDSYQVDVDGTLVVEAGQGVLANDGDVDGDSLTAVLVDAPAHGTLTLNADGSFTYTPESGFRGIDSFTYQASDGELTSQVATVTITVNTAPVGQHDAYELDEDGALTVDAATGVLANDADPDGDSLTAVLVTPPSHGTLTLNPDGSFEYAPAADFHGTDTFTYVANDGLADSNVVTVTITVNPVNDAPVAQDDTYEMDEDGVLTVDAAAGVLANDTDADGDPLTAVLVTPPNHGTLTLNPDGSFEYTPDVDFHGTDSFSYVANDGTENSNVATVSIVVNPVNDPPVGVADLYVMDMDEVLEVEVGAGVLANDTDADGDSLTAVLVEGPAWGTLDLNPDGSFTYTPASGFRGEDRFTYQAFDGEELSEVVEVTIEVHPLTRPIARDDTFEVQEDSLLADNLFDVMANDVFNDGATPFPVVIVTPPQHGTADVAFNLFIRYQPNPNFFGTDTLEYQINDGAPGSQPDIGRVTIHVLPVNDAPIAVDDSFEGISQDSANTVLDVLANDSPGPGEESIDSITIISVNDFSEGGSATISGTQLLYTPATGFSGTETFTYTIEDSFGLTATATVTVLVNDPPVSADDAYSVATNGALVVVAEQGVLANDTDANGHALVAILLSGPAHGALTLNADGSFTYTPDSDFQGTDTFTYVSNDGYVDSEVATVTIEVGETGGGEGEGEGEGVEGASFEDLADGLFAGDDDWLFD